MGKYKEFAEWGSKGGEQKGINNRKKLLEEVSRLTSDKGLLDFISTAENNDLIKEAIIELRRRNNEKNV
jgi:hypothetical protein